MAAEEEKTVVEEIMDNRRTVENMTREGEYDYQDVKLGLGITGVTLLVVYIHHVVTTGSFLI